MGQGEGSVRPKNVKKKKSMKLNIGISRGVGVLEKAPSIWEVCIYIFPGTTH